jgi:2-methylisocitrate lyase-like PEP mutase family enzyme
MSSLLERLHAKCRLRAIEAHSGLSAHIGSIAQSSGEIRRAFDIIWASSLTASASCLLPDAELNLLNRRLSILDDILRSTEKPVVVDAETGGDVLAFAHLVRNLARMGAAAVCAEDKKLPKRNSFSNEPQTLEDPHAFGEKIAVALRTRRERHPLICARIESLIAGASVEDALARAEIYGAAGAEALLVHSREFAPLVEFARAYRARSNGGGLPLICVPTAFPAVPDGEIFAVGFNVVVYANHLLRAAWQAMIHTAARLLDERNALAVNMDIVSVAEVLRTLDSTLTLPDGSYERSEAAVTSTRTARLDG